MYVLHAGTFRLAEFPHPYPVNSAEQVIEDLPNFIIYFNGELSQKRAGLFGADYPFLSEKWKKSNVDTIFSLFNIMGLIVGIMLVFQFGPAWLFDPNIGPFLFNKLVIPVGLLVPISAGFLALLVGYGLLKFVGVLA